MDVSNLNTFNDVIVEYVKTDRRLKGIASALLRLAQSCEDGNDFLAKCKAAEAYIMSDDARDYKVTEIPRAWNQAKSDIAAGMGLGLNPKEFKSYHEFREQKIERKKQSRAANDVDRPEKDARGPTESIETVDPMNEVSMDLLPIVKFLSVLPEHTRKRWVKRATTEAKELHDTYLNGRKEGGRQQIAATQ